MISSFGVLHALCLISYPESYFPFLFHFPWVTVTESAQDVRIFISRSYLCKRFR